MDPLVFDWLVTSLRGEIVHVLVVIVVPRAFSEISLQSECYNARGVDSRPSLNRFSSLHSQGWRKHR